MTNDDKYIRKVQTAVNNFIYCGDDYLFLQRNLNKRVDPGKLNGVGGRLEPGEDFFTALIRETREETGYEISSKDIKLAGVVKLEGGYDEDWVICYFKSRVSSKKIPHGNKTEDGDFVWIHKDAVLDTKYDLIEDIKILFKDIVVSDCIFFMTAKVDENYKMYDISIGRQY